MTHRFLRLGLTLAVAALAAPAPADAHLRSGTIAVDDTVSVLRPDTPAYRVQVFQSDHGLTLVRRPGHTVVMLGYLGEPVFRLDRAGLWVNTASPTAAVVGLLKKGQRTLAAASSSPRWRLRRGRRSVTWHDARLAQLPAGTTRARWHVPLIVDGDRVVLTGRLRRFPKPALALWLGLLVVLTAGGSWPLIGRRRERVDEATVGLAMLGAAASVMTGIVFSLDAYASPGTLIETGDEILFIVVGLGVLLRAPAKYHAGAVLGLGAVSLAVGLIHGAVFLHPIVLAVLSGTVVRVVVVVSIAAGFDAALLGCLRFVRPAAPPPEARPRLDYATAVLATRKPGAKKPAV